MTRFLATASALALGLVAIVSQAQAADLGTRAPAPVYTKAPAYVPVSNWSGLYIGGNVGYGWGNGVTDFAQFVNGAVLIDDFAPFTVDAKSRGVIGGAQLGYNWQVGTFVGGLEADFQGSGVKGSASAIPADATFVTATSNQSLSWFGTVRGRVGFTVTPDFLLYGTGGLAYGQVENSANTIFAGNPFPSSTTSTRVGWAAGGGAEWKFTRNWSAKVEYVHLDLGTVSTDAVFGSPETFHSTFHNQFDTVRFGVNYHFN